MRAVNCRTNVAPAMNTYIDTLDDDALSSDDRRAALNYFTEAFAEAVSDGIDGDCFAHAALFASFRELVATFGEEAVAKYAESLPGRIRDGSFTIASRH